MPAIRRPPLTTADRKAELGWVTSWRRADSNGVLMPMRLDIQIDRTGRVSQLTMNDRTWVPAWYITRTLGDMTTSGYVDAVTGKRFDPAL